MTPEEILNEFASKSAISLPMALSAKAKAIEAIKQYAREMCDKQKVKCGIRIYNETANDAHKIIIENVSYPIETL